MENPGVRLNSLLSIEIDTTLYVCDSELKAGSWLPRRVFILPAPLLERNRQVSSDKLMPSIADA